MRLARARDHGGHEQRPAEQVEAVQPNGVGVEEVVADKGYHSDATLVALDTIGVRSHVSEPERGRRCWQDKKTGEKPPEKAAAQKALYGNRRRVRGRRGRRLQRCRGEVVERTFAHLYETGGMRRVWVRGHENVRGTTRSDGMHRARRMQRGLLPRAVKPLGMPCRLLLMETHLKWVTFENRNGTGAEVSPGRLRQDPAGYLDRASEASAAMHTARAARAWSTIAWKR